MLELIAVSSVFAGRCFVSENSFMSVASERPTALKKDKAPGRDGQQVASFRHAVMGAKSGKANISLADQMAQLQTQLDTLRQSRTSTPKRAFSASPVRSISPASLRNPSPGRSPNQDTVDSEVDTDDSHLSECEQDSQQSIEKVASSDEDEGNVSRHSPPSAHIRIEDIVQDPVAHAAKQVLGPEAYAHTEGERIQIDRLLPTEEDDTETPEMESGGVAEPSPWDIPEELRHLAEVTSATNLEEVSEDWRVAEEPLVRRAYDATGSKAWTFIGGGVPNNQAITLKSGLVMERTVSGKTLIALTDLGKKWQGAVLAMGKLRQPAESSLHETEQRRKRRLKLLDFLHAQGTCAEALGGWKANDENSGVVINRLPIIMQDILENKTRARPSSPPLAFSLQGKEGSEAEGFHKAVYQDSNFKDFFE